MDNILTETAETTGLEEPGYDASFRAKIEAALADPRPSIPHAEAMARIDAIIARAEKRR